MRRGWLFCSSFFLSFLLNAKLPFSTLRLRRALFNSNSQISKVKEVSSKPSSTVAIQPLYELGEYLPRTFRQYFPRLTSSKMPLPILSAVLDPCPPTETLAVLNAFGSFFTTFIHILASIVVLLFSLNSYAFAFCLLSKPAQRRNLSCNFHL